MIKNKLISLILFPSLLILTTILIVLIASNSNKNKPLTQLQNIGKPSQKQKLLSFNNVEELKRYLSQTNENSTTSNVADVSRSSSLEKSIPPNAAYGFSNSSAPTDTRYSETNVQIIGIDEPDIVKNNAQTIFLAKQPQFYPYHIMEKRIAPVIGIRPPVGQSEETKIIDAYPPSKLSETGSIKKSGNLFLKDNTLVILGDKTISALDVQNAASPQEKWTMQLEESTRVNQARLIGKSAYIVVNNYLNNTNPCPITLYKINNQNISIPCNEIQYPTTPTQVDSLYTILKINIETGKVEDKTAIVASSYNVILSMSQNALYLTYPNEIDQFEYLHLFYNQDGKDLIPSTTLNHINKIKEYDLSKEAKLTELMQSVQQYLYSNTPDDNQTKQNQMQNRLISFGKKHKREFEKSGLVKFELNTLSQAKITTFAGKALNQFSIDEYNDTLRITTSVSGSLYGMTTEAASNDLYTFNNQLQQIGQIQDMGINERIYATRFIKDQAYVVTFKQTDPLYIINLKDPSNPKITGQLKIPGYSAYLHPLTDSLLLGIGKQDAQVKASLFNIQDPANPIELDSYILKDYNSDILQTHLAFLHDPKHQIFFIPGTQNGYIMSYEGNKLQLRKAIVDIDPQRALYINDYLYIIGQNSIKIYNENTWEQENKLTLD